MNAEALKAIKVLNEYYDTTCDYEYIKQENKQLKKELDELKAEKVKLQMLICEYRCAWVDMGWSPLDDEPILEEEEEENED